MATWLVCSRLTLCTLFVILISATAGYGDLVGLYTFDDGLPTDSSGNGNHATIVGSPVSRSTGGAVDNLGYFQFGMPVTAYLQTPLSVDPEEAPQLTMGAWARIYSDTTEDVRQMLAHDDGGWDRGLGTDLRGDGEGAGDITYRWTGFTGNGPLGFTTPVDDQRDEWIFLAVVYDNLDQLMTIYVDDEPFESLTAFGTSTRNLKIGGNPVYGEFWSGDIDNAFVFDQALSGDEIEAIRLGGPEVIKILGESAPRGLVNAWTFEDGTLGGFGVVEGTAFDSQPTLHDNPLFRNAAYVAPYGTGIRGDYFVGTFENYPSADYVRGGTQGDGPIGIVETAPFALATGAHFDLLVGGGDHPWDPSWDPETNLPPADATGPTTVNLEREVAPGDWEVLFASTGLANEAMHFIRWDASDFVGETVRLRIYDYNTSGWGHINVDDIRYYTTDVITGDYNGNGALDAGDLDLQAAAIAEGNDPPEFDLNGDGVVDHDGDRIMWLHELKKVFVGDVDLNGSFDSSDFVAVFVAGKYETGEHASWAEGDWNADLIFDSGDFVAAFADGGYERVPFPGAVQAVPEPGGILATFIALCVLIGAARRVRS